MATRNGGSVVAVLALALAACAAQPVGTAVLRGSIVAEAAFDCFAAGLKDEQGELAYCEPSAAVVSGDEVVLASDKPVPGASPVFALRRNGHALAAGPVRPLMAAALRTAAKIEGFAATPDGRHVIATTAFDRYEAGSARWDAYNTLLVWPHGSPEQTRVVAPSRRDGATSSRALRATFERHLGVPYFKIEGLAALPGGRLLFGVRETGRRYDDFEYRMLILEARYRIDGDGDMHVEDGLRTLLDFVPAAALRLPAGIGLSSLEYDPVTGRIYLLTSHELDGRLGAYLWHTDIAALDAGRPPMPVQGDDGKPLRFDNKAEGMAVVDRHHLFVVHDDDRLLGGKHGRQPHQAVYSVVRIGGD